MPHYDTRHGFRLIDPSEVEKWDILQKAVRVLHPATWAKIIRTVDSAIISLKPSLKSKLVWTKSGAIFGHKSSQPLEAIDHVWEHSKKMFGPTAKENLLFVGSLLYWRISLRGDQWFSYPNEKGTTDPLTGREITERGYWINNHFAVPIKKQPTVSDLVAKFSKVGRK